MKPAGGDDVSELVSMGPMMRRVTLGDGGRIGGCGTRDHDVPPT